LEVALSGTLTADASPSASALVFNDVLKVVQLLRISLKSLKVTGPLALAEATVLSSSSSFLVTNKI
jgi:hypothetical protein